jgi:hypothetical protein
METSRLYYGNNFPIDAWEYTQGLISYILKHEKIRATLPFFFLDIEALFAYDFFFEVNMMFFFLFEVIMTFFLRPYNTKYHCD